MAVIALRKLSAASAPAEPRLEYFGPATVTAVLDREVELEISVGGAAMRRWARLAIAIAYQPQVSFELINFMELIGESMGIHIPDLYKRLRLMGDIDSIVADSADLISAYRLDLDTVRDVLAQEMLGAG